MSAISTYAEPKVGDRTVVARGVPTGASLSPDRSERDFYGGITIEQVVTSFKKGLTSPNIVVVEYQVIDERGVPLLVTDDRAHADGLLQALILRDQA